VPEFIDASLNEHGRIGEQSQIRTLLWYMRGTLLTHGCMHWGSSEVVNVLEGSMWHITPREELYMPGYVAVTQVEDPWDRTLLNNFDQALRCCTGQPFGTSDFVSSVASSGALSFGGDKKPAARRSKKFDDQEILKATFSSLDEFLESRGIAVLGGCMPAGRL